MWPVLNDPDFSLEWSKVALVIVPTVASPVCAICLDSPICPRLVQCGHFFCQLCLLRYYALCLDTPLSKSPNSKSWRRCPVCFEMVSLKDTRPVHFAPLEDVIKSGGWCKFVLRRHPSPSKDISSLDDLCPFDRYTRVTPALFKQLQENIAVELDQLVSTLEGLDYDLIKAHLQTISLDPTIDNSTLSPTLPRSSVYFHQAADGQQLYLHPLNIKMLKEAYGSYSGFPSVLHLHILQIDWLTLTEESRRRFKNLSHLPLGTSVGLCEVDLTDVIPSTVIASYAKELAGRARTREQRARSDEARKQLADYQESIRIQAECFTGTIIPSQTLGTGLRLDDTEMFPVVGGSTESERGIPIKGTSSSLIGSFASIAASTSPSSLLSSSPTPGKKHKKVLLLSTTSHRQLR